MPADAFVADLASVPSLDAAEKYLRAGMPDDAARIDRARLADDFYQFRNPEHLLRRPDEDDRDFKARPKRYSRLARTVTRKLAVLYSPGPTREWQGDAKVHGWLEAAYAAAAVNTRLMGADRAATLGHVAALQVEPTGDPKRPLRYWLWKGHEFAVFLRDGDPIDPYAVCTLDTIPDPQNEGKTCTRFRLWSAAERRTLLSAPHGAAGCMPLRATRYHPDPEQSGPSPFPGVLPFVFARNEPADSQFWEGGIGEALSDLNRELDRGLSDNAEHLWAFLNPYLTAKGVKASQRITLKAGVPFHLEADPSTMSGDNRVEPKLEYLQAQLGVEAAWFDLKAYADSQLEELEVPLTVVRSDASTDLSGVAIVAKSLPLAERTRGRQPEWAELEVALAAKSLAVAGLHYKGDLAETLVAAAKDPKLVCTWPEPKVPLPTPERDQGDEWLLANRLADPIEVLAARRGITLAQAEQLAGEMAKRWKTWEGLLGATGASGSPTDSVGDDADEPGDDPEPDPAEE